MNSTKRLYRHSTTEKGDRKILKGSVRWPKGRFGFTYYITGLVNDEGEFPKQLLINCWRKDKTKKWVQVKFSRHNIALNTAKFGDCYLCHAVKQLEGELFCFTASGRNSKIDKACMHVIRYHTEHVHGKQWRMAPMKKSLSLTNTEQMSYVESHHDLDHPILDVKKEN